MSIYVNSSSVKHKEEATTPLFKIEFFGVKSMVLMVVLSIALLGLPLVLPPLPPPPTILMFLPILIMSLLVMEALSLKDSPHHMLCSSV